MFRWAALLAFAIGALLPLQAGVNAQLRLYAGHPVGAALISFAVGTLALTAGAVGLRLPLPGIERFAGVPWWVWTGGLLGAVYVALAVVLAPRLGAATLVGLTVAGQMIGSIILDHFGIAGFAVREATLSRLLGAALLLAGVALINRT